jgi:hypothetical protein
MQKGTLEDLFHWEQRGLGPGLTLHRHGLHDVQTCLFVSFCSLLFYFLGDIPFHSFPLLFKWTRLWTCTPQPLGLGSLQRGLFYLGRLCPWPWRTFPLHSIETPYDMHTRGGNYKLKVRQFDVGDFVYF